MITNIVLGPDLSFNKYPLGSYVLKNIVQVGSASVDGQASMVRCEIQGQNS